MSSFPRSFLRLGERRVGYLLLPVVRERVVLERYRERFKRNACNWRLIAFGRQTGGH